MRDYARHPVYIALDMDGLLTELPDDATWEVDPKTGLAPWEEPGSNVFASALPQQRGILLAQAVSRHTTRYQKDRWEACVLTKLHPDAGLAIRHTEQKVQWLKSHGVSLPVVFCPSDMPKSKRFCAWKGIDTLDPRCVLVDDYHANAEEWQEAGGLAFLWNPNKKDLRERRRANRIGEAASAEEVCRMIALYTDIDAETTDGRR